MTLVNQAVKRALAGLGYQKSDVTTIREYIEAHSTIEGGPGLREDHLPVFDCAFRPSHGTRSIHWSGHIDMMPVAALPILPTGPSAVQVQSIVHSAKASQLGHHLPPLLRMMQRATRSDGRAASLEVMRFRAVGEN